jgi:hypothetical protein
LEATNSTVTTCSSMPQSSAVIGPLRGRRRFEGLENENRSSAVHPFEGVDCSARRSRR